ncbi:MAG: glycosyltransferase family 4 protein [Rhodocyclaceae bacterium]|jgi:glycosyltransferase involved in cell wall biosynthesis|nr:glycosyltransferase family 4 protein [Rhodocyclaceae bacterium]
MNIRHPDVTLVVRECGERTAETCVRLLQEMFPSQPIFRISAQPFSTTLRQSLEKGLAEGRPWTLCIDADVLPLPELGQLLNEARALPDDAFEIQGLVFDKLLAAPRAAGNHLYRTRLIEQALPLIPANANLRPETAMIGAMAANGFSCHQSRMLVGLHDFEQSYGDLYAKAYLHGHKHRFLLPLVRPLWQILAYGDDDYRIAQQALCTADDVATMPAISRQEHVRDASQALAELGLEEKRPYAHVPHAGELQTMMQAIAPRGEARSLSRQISSVIERGTFPNRLSDQKQQAASATSCPRVAFVCGNAYPLFDFTISPTGGGMESRAALFARGLTETGRWHVNFVVSDFGQEFLTCHEGIDFHIYQPAYRRAGRNVFPRLRKRRWFPVLNLDRRDLDLLWQIPMIAAWLALPALFFPRFWRQLKPDVVCCFGNNERTAEVVADCRRAGIRTILCIASDKDLSPDYRPGNREPNHYGMPQWHGHYTLTHSDAIIVQTEAQQAALRLHFGRTATLIRNPVHVFPDDPYSWRPRPQREYILWIGRTDEFNKRPGLFLQLASECPGIDFLMIVSRTDDACFRALERSRPANLRIVEHVPAAEIRAYLQRARVLVNTSKFEGFPNTFLQAAVTGTPIASLEVDPDGMLSKLGCGICAQGDTGRLRTAVLTLWNDDEEAERHARSCHGHVLERHAAADRIADFSACLEEQRRLGVPVRPVGLKRFS